MKTLFMIACAAVQDSHRSSLVAIASLYDRFNFPKLFKGLQNFDVIFEVGKGLTKSRVENYPMPISAYPEEPK